MASICAEQRAAFIARWQQRAIAFVAEPLESPPSEQLQLDDDLGPQPRDEAVDGSALYAMWLG